MKLLNWEKMLFNFGTGKDVEFIRVGRLDAG